MRVTRLELFGFKSFPERTIVPLDGGVTGVVGPNGCGKSNVVDALRWVLGETRASQLRGGNLEDVIFNGTDKMRPLGLAEVTLTLRSDENEDFGSLVSPQAEALKIAEDAIAAARVAKKENGSHLSVVESVADNSNKELSEEDSSSADEKDTAEVNPEESLEKTDEAKDLDHESNDKEISSDEDPDPEAQTDVSFQARFAWLKSVTEVQVTRRLYRSGESEFYINKIPCRLRDMRDLCRAVGISARSYTIVAQGEVGRIVTAKPQELRSILEEASGIAGFRDKAAEAGRRLAETEQNIARMNDIIIELERQVSILSRQASRARKREELKTQVSGLEKQLFFDTMFRFHLYKDAAWEEFEALRGSEAEIEAQFLEAEAAETQSIERARSIESQIDGIREELDAARAAISQSEREKNRLQSKLAEYQGNIHAAEQELSRLYSRQNTLTERKAITEEELAALCEQDESLSERIDEADSGQEEALRHLSESLARTREEVKTKERAFRQAREEYISVRSQKDAVEEQITAASPLAAFDSESGENFKESLESRGQMFLQEVEVPQAYGRALQSVLGEKASFFLTDDPFSVGAEFLDYLDSLEEEERKGVGLGLCGQRRESFESWSPPGDFHGSLLIDALNFPETHRGFLEHYLKDVWITEDGKEAARFLKTHTDIPASVTFVTKDGDMLTPLSFYSNRHDSGVVQLRIRQSELEKQYSEMSEIQENLREELDSLVESEYQMEQEHAALLVETQEKQQVVRDLGREQGTVRGRIAASRQLLQQISEDLRQITISMEGIRDSAEDNRRREEALYDQIEAFEDSSMHGTDDKIKSLEVRLHDVLEDRQQLRGQSEALSDQCRRLKGMLEGVRQQLNKRVLESKKNELEEETLRERIVSEYGDLVLEAFITEFQEALENEALEERDSEIIHNDALTLKECKKKLIRIGEVDPSVIERYEEERTRLEELLEQRADLAEGATLIRESIEKLTNTSEERFMACFNAVKNTFSVLVPKLFGGGWSDLELSNPEKPLESGVRVLVRPPGKKPKSIDLLSGGEKALCATALIFAMFQQRPSPLCVLDEVDAPLDDANLSRFLALVREMTSITQFLLITHNKVSMAAADNLVGVTQPNLGASRLISVSLQQAEKEAAY